MLRHVTLINRKKDKRAKRANWGSFSLVHLNFLIQVRVLVRIKVRVGVGVVIQVRVWVEKVLCGQLLCALVNNDCASIQ